MISEAKLASGGIGGALRAYRRRAGLTLAELHQRSGLALSTLSKAENNKISLTYDKIEKICLALGIDMAQIVAPGPVSPAIVVSGRRSIVRSGEGQTIESEHYADTYLVTELLHKGMTPVIVDVKARSIENFDDFHRHAGEEYVYVLEGAVDFHTELYAPVRLVAGDSIYFDSETGHAWIAAAPGACRFLSICLRSRPAVAGAATVESAPAVLDISMRRRSAG